MIDWADEERKEQGVTGSELARLCVCVKGLHGCLHGGYTNALN